MTCVKVYDLRGITVDMIRDSLMELFRIVNHLENVYAEHGRKFTIDGHLIGSIGEVLAAEAYNLKLAENSTPVYDAETRDASQKKVQIKATQIGFPFPQNVSMMRFQIM